MVIKGHAKTAVEAMKIINIEREKKISPETVRRALRECWLIIYRRNFEGLEDLLQKINSGF